MITHRTLALLVVATLAVSDTRSTRTPGAGGGPGTDRPGGPVDPGGPSEPGTPGGPEGPLDPADEERFQRGLALFTRSFHRSSGLGSPELNADSCGACHRDPVPGGAGALELNVSRFGRERLGVFEDLPGGQALAKLRPPWIAGREEQPSEADVFEQRQTPSILGDGLIERIPVGAILANEDPLDRDGDGIRGVARRIAVDGALELGRFGWKAQVPRLIDFARDALGNELGITVWDDGRGFARDVDGDERADPELDEPGVFDLTFFLSQLAAPARKGSLAPDVLLGELVFERVGCVKCHVPELPSASGPVHLYSDLLLHDVWPDSFRGMSEPDAGPGVYRTPPLWGVGATAPYLHDGRASSLRQAILLHDGEARGVRQAFEARPPVERSALIAFLEDL